MSDAPLTTADPDAVARRLEAVRQRTLALVAVLDGPTLRRQHVPILSPMVWDLGHIGNFEELWLVQALGRQPPLQEGFQRMFDAVLNPRPTRDALPLPEGRDLHRYLAAVRERTLAVLARPDGADPALLRDGFVYEMVAQHEEQHQETLLQLTQLLEEPPYTPALRRVLPVAAEVAEGMVPVAGGRFEMGWEEPGFAYDNELPRHAVEVPPFRIDRLPVTCGQYLGFVEAGGYGSPELWSEAGWRWRQESGAEAPGNWLRRDGAWQVRFMDRIEPLPRRTPVVHVCYHEAEAFARWAGKRLPTEAEWEKAALWDPATGRARRYPWGNEPPTRERANLDQLTFRPAPVGTFPAGASPCGAQQMVGDVWEWTSSDFTPYPGFRAFPYPEYSEIFFGPDYKVLRGGSWATRPAVARGTFRNWDYPIRRQIFAGFRCARDA